MASASFKTKAQPRLSNLSTANVKKAKFIDVPGRSTFEETLPFRIKFINIGIEAYGPNNPAPIGIAVIGLNNYVL